MGGGDEDKCIYGVGDYAPKNTSAEYDPWTVRNKTAANLLLITPVRYAELAEFASATDLRLVFAFNIFYGVCCHTAFGGHCPNASRSASGSDSKPAAATAACRKFDVSNAEAMLRHMKSTDTVPWCAHFTLNFRL